MHSRKLALVPILCVALAGCDVDETYAPVDIRVRNESAVVMHDVVIGFPGPAEGGNPVQPGNAESGDVSYGTIAPSQATPYRTIARAYSYAAVRLTVDGEPFELTPDDYVGESLLERGRYTYELHFENGALLGVTAVRD